MKRFTMFACLALALVFAFASYAELPRVVDSNGSEILHGGGQGFAKAGRDTIVLIGPGSTYRGDFEDAFGNAALNGWTSVDYTESDDDHWHIYTTAPIAGVYSVWCGETFDNACGEGYGNSWNQLLEYRATVDDAGLSCTVTVVADYDSYTEGGWDYSFLSYETAQDGLVDVLVLTDAAAGTMNETFTYTPADYVGNSGNEVSILFRLLSDGAVSDEDCDDDFTSFIIDNVNITLSNGPDFASDFEDGTLGMLAHRTAPAVGDFAHIVTGLEDEDPCNANYSAQMTFIDDGIVVPGTGGSPCNSYCYGPGGYTINVTGGLAGKLGFDLHMDNAILSPVVAWADQSHDGCSFLFDVYRHMPLANGAFYVWGVRACDADSGQTIADGVWGDRNFVYYSNTGDYIRGGDTFCGDLLVAGRDSVQVSMGVYELGWVWGFVGEDATPAPYFDNVRLISFPTIGPNITAREIDLANDNFPSQGLIDYVNLGTNSVRFDGAMGDTLNVPNDSLTFTVVVTRAGASLVGMPRMYYTLEANPVFDAFRTSGLPNQGYVECGQQLNGQGAPIADSYWADLPDEGFLFPGDVLHYYLWAQDDGPGGVQTATLPADTTGFSVFDPYNALSYNSSFTVRALPSIASDLSHPGLLFWNDFANRGGQQEWHSALANLGLLAGRDYDVYYTNGPSSGVGNGLGGRATPIVLEGYSDMLYTAGDLSSYTLSNGNPDDPEADRGNDVAVVTDWLNATNGDLYMTGDGIALDMYYSSPTFMSTKMGVSIQSSSVRTLIGTQTAPRILAEVGNPVIQNVPSWIAFGGCPGINRFDAVTATSAVRIAQYANAAGAPGGYSYAAGTLNDLSGTNAGRIVYMPYDFMYIYTDPNEGAKVEANLSARARVLRDVLSYFGVAEIPADATPVPGAEKFAVRNFPNPFNPKTTIAYTVAKPGHLTLKVFNVRGELVKTLVDGNVEVSSTIEWDGTNNAGGKVSSGVYFYEARMGSDVVVNKMALVK